MDAATTLKYLRDAIPQGPHPDPHAEWVSVRLDVVHSALDTLEYTERGLAEWRDVAEVAMRHVENLTSDNAAARENSRLPATVWLSMFTRKPTNGG